jgi:ankyrin repeat protein
LDEEHIQKLLRSLKTQPPEQLPNELQRLSQSQIKKLLQRLPFIIRYERLFQAARDNGRLIQLLQNAGTNVNVQNLVGWTVFMKASSEGQIEAVNLLLAAKANVDLRDDEGNIALRLAPCASNSSAMVSLLANSADIDA